MAEWEAFNTIQPIGDWREDYRTGLLASVETNIARSLNTKKGHTPKFVEPNDFIPDWGNREKEKEVEIQSTDEQKDILLNFANTHNKNQKGKTKKPVKRKK